MRRTEERRRRTRVTTGTPGEPSLRFRAGATVDVLDLSAGGAQVETERYLGPGASLELVLGLSSGPVSVRARVVHSRIVRLDAGRRPRYRVGLRFPEELPALPAP